MKIIYQNSISGTPTSSAGNLSADYAVAKVLNDVPKQPYIANTHTSVLITVNLKTQATLNEMSFFMTYLAESASVVFKNGASAIGSATVYTNSYDFSNPYFYLDKTIWNDSIFLDIPENTTKIEITLSNSIDRKSSITNWDSNDVDSRGKFLETAATILYENYAQIRLGTSVQDNADNAFYQINRITGIGSGNTDIQLTPEINTDFTISNMYLPIYVNTIRAGKSYEIFNPSVGVNVQRDSFGIVKDRDSGINYRLGEIRKVYSGTVQVLEAERTTVTNIIEGLRNRPVAMKVLDYQGETAVFGSFFEIPGFTYSNQGSRIYDMGISFTEIV